MELLQEADVPAPLSRRDRAVLAIFDQLPNSMIISDALAAFISGRCTKSFRANPDVQRIAPKVRTGIRTGGRRVRDVRNLISAESAETVAACEVA